MALSERVASTLSKHQMVQIILQASGYTTVDQTTIQNLVYLANAIHQLGIEGYKPNYYGPYNPVLRENLKELAKNNLIYTDPIPDGGYLIFRYNLTDNGNMAASALSNSMPDKYNKVASTVKTCIEECELDTNSLSFATQMHYKLDEAGKSSLSYDKVNIMAKQFGWDLAQIDVDKGAKLLNTLGLITLTK